MSQISLKIGYPREVSHKRGNFRIDFVVIKEWHTRNFNGVETVELNKISQG